MLCHVIFSADVRGELVHAWGKEIYAFSAMHEKGMLDDMCITSRKRLEKNKK